MMEGLESKLEKLGLKLATAKPPVANYLGTKQVGNLLYVSGRKSELNGVVGVDVTEEQARMAARDTVILILSIIENDINDLDKIEGVIKLQGFINASSSFTRILQVLDGASELLILLFGENGRHAQTATGAGQLPYGAAIQLDMILSLRTV